MGYEILHGDCLDVMALCLDDNSVDAIVTDPPYGLGFMGKHWDHGVPGVEFWQEMLRILKPGGHLLAFAGTRTQHRMASNIEDAGFEIRDMIAWVYGSGFPKSLDVSKAIDKAAGAEREVVGLSARHGSKAGSRNFADGKSGFKSTEEGGNVITAPATEAARQWQGWGTALKPALETVTLASKPYTQNQERDIIKSNLIRLEARLWLLSLASAAEKSSTSSRSEFDVACVIARWSADEITSTRAALCDPMGTSLFELATTTSLSIVSSWRRTLEENWSDGSMFTIETRSSTTIDWRTLRFSLSQITPESIIRACSLPGGFSANASTAENHFNASLSLLQSIRTLSATEPAISQAQHEHLGAGVAPNLDPCIMARKPLVGTVAENVLAHGTGAINVDGCRIDANGDPQLAEKYASVQNAGARSNSIYGTDARDRAGAAPHSAGRWPANLIHDGSEEVLALFPDSNGAGGSIPNVKVTGYGDGIGTGKSEYFGGERQKVDSGSGSAARFFYCAKASKKDRNEGCDHIEAKQYSHDGRETPIDNAYQRNSSSSSNHHPTVKPTDLMRYLCRLVTPPGGVVLDPFMGSGSTGKAAVLEGFRFIGIEREDEYIPIAEARIRSAAA